MRKELNFNSLKVQHAAKHALTLTAHDFLLLAPKEI